MASQFFNNLKQKATSFLDKLKNSLSGQSARESGSAPKTETASSAALIGALKEMEDAYNKRTNPLYEVDTSSIPDTLGQTYKTYTEKTPSEIAAEAETSLKPGYESKADTLVEKTAAKLNMLDENKSATAIKEASERYSLESALEELSLDHRDTMIKQGLVNSSINKEGAREIEEYGEAVFEIIDLQYDLKYAEIENSVKETKLNYENALKEYKLNYAADLQEKIGALTSEQQKRVAEINAYNKKIADQEAAYQQKRAKLLITLEESLKKAREEKAAADAAYEAEHGMSAEKRNELDSRYQVAESFYSQYGAADAYKMIVADRDTLVPLLGTENYLLLLRKQFSGG